MGTNIQGKLSEQLMYKVPNKNSALEPPCHSSVIVNVADPTHDKITNFDIMELKL